MLSEELHNTTIVATRNLDKTIGENVKKMWTKVLSIGLPSYVEKMSKTWEVHVSLNLVEKEL